MRNVLILLSAVSLLLVLPALSSAQIPIPWMPEGVTPLVFGFENPPLIDGVLDEWAEISEDYYFTTEQFGARPAGNKQEIDLTDFALTVWSAWCPATNKFYFASQWFDNMCMQDATESGWNDKQDRWELEVDADGSGGQVYVYDDEGDATYVRRYRNAQAQQYGLCWPPSGSGAIWYHWEGFPVEPPYAEAMGTFEGTPGGEGTVTIECMVSPFNDISIDEGTYELQDLEEGGICRLDHVIEDVDDESYHYFLVLNDQDGTYETSDRWIEFMLDEVTPGSGGPTAVQQSTWGAMKAQFE
jgi:hypothetical protein